MIDTRYRQVGTQVFVGLSWKLTYPIGVVKTQSIPRLSCHKMVMYEGESNDNLNYEHL